MKTQLKMIWKMRILSNILVIAIAFLITGAECKRSACWRYGHVCWGGHGKRSGQSPVIPESGSMETDGGTGSLPVYSPSLPGWSSSGLTPGLQPFEPLSLVTNVREGPMAVMMDPKAIQKLQIQNQKNRMKHAKFLLPRFINPIMMRQSERQFIQRNPMTNDALVVPSDVAMSKMSMAREISPISTVKRSEGDVQENVGTSGTEETLETSDNGLDNAGSVATFFRDRKSSSKTAQLLNQFEKERYLNVPAAAVNNALESSGRRLRLSNFFDLLPMTQYILERNIFPRSTVNY